MQYDSFYQMQKKTFKKAQFKKNVDLAAFIYSAAANDIQVSGQGMPTMGSEDKATGIQSNE